MIHTITDRERGCLVWLQGALAGGAVFGFPALMTVPMIDLVGAGLVTYTVADGAQLTEDGRKALAP